MQSAKDFAKDITAMPYYVSPTKSERTAALIRARDREIVEACKKVIMGSNGSRPLDTYEHKWAFLICAKLESVLRDLG